MFNFALTQKLKNLMDNSFSVADALELIRDGADPNAKDSHGKTLIHKLTKNENNKTGKFNEIIKELVKTYNTDINIQDAEGLTPLQCLMNAPFTAKDAMQLVKLGADPSVKNKDGNTLFHILVKNNMQKNDQAIKTLVKKVDINAKNDNGLTALQYLINGKFSTKDAKDLVALGANPNEKDQEGSSLLHILVRCNKESNCNGKAIKELVKTYNADINIKDAQGLTPLQCLMNGPFTTENAMQLVKLGADPSVKNKDGNTLFHILVKNNMQKNDQAIKTLVKKVDINAKNDNGLTALQYLINGKFSTKDAKDLVALGANPNEKDQEGSSLLHILVRCNKESNCNGKAIKELVKTYNADINIQDAQGLTPLQCLMNGPFTAKDAMQLVKLGADPSVKDKDGNTLFHILVKNNMQENDQAIKTLVKKVDINAKNDNGLTALQYLINGKFSTKDAKDLVALGANPNEKDQEGSSLLHILVRCNKESNCNGKAIKELVKTYNADINIQDAQGLTPLQCLMNGPFTAKDAMQLVKLGADPSVKNKDGNTLFHILVKNNMQKNDQAIKPLVKKVDINAKNDNGLTALQYLINGKFSTKDAMDLVALGASPNEKDQAGNSLLHILVRCNKESNRNGEAIKTLVNMYNADINIKDAQGLTPLQCLMNAPFTTENAMQLVKLGADPSVKNKDGNTLLQILEMTNENNKNSATIATLKSTKSDFSIKYPISSSRISQTGTLVNCTKTQSVNVVEKIKAPEVTIRKSWDEQCIRRLINSKTDINEKDAQGYTALQYLLEKQKEPSSSLVTDLVTRNATISEIKDFKKLKSILFDAVKGLRANEKVSRLSCMLDPNHPLGKVMWVQRGWFATRVTGGFLKSIHQELMLTIKNNPELLKDSKTVYQLLTNENIPVHSRQQMISNLKNNDAMAGELLSYMDTQEKGNNIAPLVENFLRSGLKGYSPLEIDNMLIDITKPVNNSKLPPVENKKIEPMTGLHVTLSSDYPHLMRILNSTDNSYTYPNLDEKSSEYKPSAPPLSSRVSVSSNDLLDTPNYDSTALFQPLPIMVQKHELSQATMEELALLIYSKEEELKETPVTEPAKCVENVPTKEKITNESKEDMFMRNTNQVSKALQDHGSFKPNKAKSKNSGQNSHRQLVPS